MKDWGPFLLNRRLARVWLAVLLVADLAALCAGFGGGEFRALGAENGPLENLQSLTLLGCCGIYLWTARVEKPVALTAAVFSLLCLSLMLRELDLDDPSLGVSYILIFFIQGAGRYAVLAVLWVVAALFLARDLPRHRDTMIRYCQSTSGRIVIASGCITALGWIFDHLTAKGGFTMFCEEFIELNGYALLLLGALHARASLRSLAQDPPAAAPRD